MTETGELPVYPMTAIDEITSKTPDALFNGSATVDIIKSCIPAIKDPWEIPSIDLDAILIVIRTGTHGSDFEIESTCQECKETSTYIVNLMNILTAIEATGFFEDLDLGELKLQFKPLSYRQINAGNLVQFDMQREIASLEAIEDFTERSDFHQTILLGVIILMDQSKKDPTKSNLMYLSIFLLLTISASRELAMNLNTPFTYNIMLDCIEAKGWSTSGKKLSYSDLVFISVYGLIKNGPRLLRPIYKSIVAVLSNIAPYTKSLCKEGCEGLMYLLNVFAKNEFLLEKEDNCKSMSSLMEAINYLIAYHDESNHYL
jgi:hypothetical protein